LLEGRSPFASQLGCTSDALSGIIVPVMLRFVRTGKLARGWSLDLDQFGQSRAQRVLSELRYVPQRLKLLSLLRKTP
jgi:hypothetical protein